MGEKKRRNKDVLALIRINYCILSDSQKRVADYVAANAEIEDIRKKMREIPDMDILLAQDWALL